MSKVTLRDLLDLAWTVTKISADVRQSDTKLIKSYEIGPDECYETATSHQRYLVDQGKLVMVDKVINHHGKQTRGGAEIAWGTDFKAIPKEILDMKVTHFSQSTAYRQEGTSLKVHLETDEYQEEIKL